MKPNKKALAAAITMSLVLGVYGTAGATNSTSVYGAGTDSGTGKYTYLKADGTEGSSSGYDAKADDGKYISSNKESATASNNSFEVKSGEWYIVDGGYISTSTENVNAKTSGNTIKVVSGDDITVNYHLAGAYAYAKGAALASNNNVSVSNGHNITINSSYSGLVGGIAVGEVNAKADSNKIVIDGDSTAITTPAIIGGSAYDNKGTNSVLTEANFNEVIINGGNICASDSDLYIYGGAAQGYGTATTSTADSNKLTISGVNTNISAQNINGGYSYHGEHDSGGKGASNASSNIVSISGGSVTVRVALDAGRASSNEGAATTANSNKLTISGDSTTLSAKFIRGGEATTSWGTGTAEAKDNEVSITGGEVTVGNSILSGKAESDGLTYADSNKLTISGDNTIVTTGYLETAYTYNYGEASGSASSNQMSITGGTVTVNNNLHVGHAEVEGERAVAVVANGNVLTISGDSTKILGNVTMASGYAEGKSKTAEANENVVTITGGSFGNETNNNLSIYAGRATAISGTTTTEKNVVNLGGYISADNTTQYAGAIDLSNVNLYGGSVFVDVTEEGKADRGNTLNVFSIGNKVKTIGLADDNTHSSFQNMKFCIPATAKSGDTMLAIVDTTGATNLNGVTIDTETTNFKGGTITLLSSEVAIQNLDESKLQINGTAGKTQDVAATITGMTNVAMRVSYDTSDAKKLSFGATGYKLTGDSDITGSATLAKDFNANAKTMKFYIPNTVTSGSTMLTVNGTADLTGASVQAGVQTGSKLKKGDSITLIDAQSITGSLASKKTMTEAGYNKYELGIDVVNNKDLVATVIKAGAGENAKSPLETMAASMTMLNMGSDMLATEGLESAVAAAIGKTESEIFAAIGYSNARVNSGSHVDVNGATFNLGFAKAIPNESGMLVIGPVVEYGTGKYDSYLDNGYHGDGNSKYWGVGLVAKQLNNTGVYYEGSLRGGKVTNDYSAADGSYDSSALYIAAHLGLGKVFKLNEKNNVDVYGKYFFTHQGGDSVEIDGNEFDFKNSNSHRTRLGARYNYNINDKNTLYGGLAWQYEFSGETAGSMDGDSIVAPSLQGHTGILELGWKVAPTKNFDMKLGMSAYTGKTRGIGAIAKLNWRF